jgi:conjugal transfer pilus assembly protein TraL
MSKEQDLSHYIPRRLDSTGKFLFWELDVAGIGVAGVLVGLGAGNPLLGLVAGVMLAFGYGKLKKGKHPGLATHLLYWWTGMPLPKDLPASHLRELNG